MDEPLLFGSDRMLMYHQGIRSYSPSKFTAAERGRPPL